MISCCAKSIGLLLSIIVFRLGHLKCSQSNVVNNDVNKVPDELHGGPEVVVEPTEYSSEAGNGKFNVYVYNGPTCNGIKTAMHNDSASSDANFAELKHEVKDLKKRLESVLHVTKLLQEEVTLANQRRLEENQMLISLLSGRDNSQNINMTNKKDELFKNEDAFFLQEVQEGLKEIKGLHSAVFEEVLSLKKSVIGGGQHVFHFESPHGAYKYTMNEAEERCRAEGMTIATVAQLHAAFHHGLDICRCGWLKDGKAAYVISWPRNACGGDNVEAGLRVCDDSEGNTYDVYCFSRK